MCVLERLVKNMGEKTMLYTAIKNQRRKRQFEENKCTKKETTI